MNPMRFSAEVQRGGLFISWESGEDQDPAELLGDVCLALEARARALGHHGHGRPEDLAALAHALRLGLEAFKRPLDTEGT